MSQTATVTIETRWMSYRKAGEYLGVSGEAIRMMVRRGRLPYVQMGKRVYIDRNDIDRLMLAGKVTPAA